MSSLVAVSSGLLAADVTWTKEGGFLFGCMLLAGLLILTQGVVAVFEASKARAPAAKPAADTLQQAASQVQSAAQGVAQAAAKNKEAAAANLEAATSSGASSVAGVAALRLIQSDANALNLVGQSNPDVRTYLTQVNLDQADAETKATEADKATKEAATAAQGAETTAEDAAEKAKETSDATLIGAVQSVTAKMPLVGGALLFALIGGLGAGIIKFAVGGQ